MPRGWGRRAAGKVSTKLEDDELFKAIGGQLQDSKFDYSQWQRQGKNAPGSRRTHRSLINKELISVFDSPLSEKIPEGFKSSGTATKEQSSRPTTLTGSFHSMPDTGASNASLLATRHIYSDATSASSLRRVKKKISKEELEDKEKAEQMKVLQLRIQTKKQTIEDYVSRKAYILEENMKLRSQIELDEANSHSTVKKLLRKYEKYRGGITTLHEKYNLDLTEAKLQLEDTRKKIELGTMVLQREVDKVDKQLSQYRDVVYVLVNYKDKEYPVKALRIADLQKEFELIDIHNQEEKNELQRIIESEKEKLQKSKRTEAKQVTVDVAQAVLNLMPDTLKEMAKSNAFLQKEVEYHALEAEELEMQIKRLKLDVKRLRRDPKTSIRQQMFPELFRKQEKCTPDMEVILNIPTHQWLPI